MGQEITILMAADGEENTRQAFKTLLAIEGSGYNKKLYTNVKFKDKSRRVSIKNIEAGYPASLLEIRNLALRPTTPTSYYKDAYDVLCLQNAAHEESKKSIIFLRDIDVQLNPKLIQRQTRSNKEFAVVVPPEDLTVLGCYYFSRGEVALNAISLAAQLYRSGAVMSLTKPAFLNAMESSFGAYLN